MFEAQIANGVEYLDLDLGKSWPSRISLEELDLADCYHCVIGQLYGDFYDRFESVGEGIPFGFEPRRHFGYAHLTQEWKEKIAQLRRERCGEP